MAEKINVAGLAQTIHEIRPETGKLLADAAQKAVTGSVPKDIHLPVAATMLVVAAGRLYAEWLDEQYKMPAETRAHIQKCKNCATEAANEALTVQLQPLMTILTYAKMHLADGVYDHLTEGGIPVPHIKIPGVKS